MTDAGVRASRSLADEYADVIAGLTDDEWAAPSGCAGWRVQDLVAHTGSNFRLLAEPPAADPDAADTAATTAEQQQEALVAVRSGWGAAAVRTEFDRFREPALGALAAVQAETVAQAPMTLADLGTYPMNLLADAFAFDLFCHLRVDLLAPGGPVDRPAGPVTDELLAPGIGWMLAGIPQMCAPVAAALDRPLGIVLDGPGGGRWTLLPGDPLPTVVEGGGDVAATVRSAATDFVVWGTKRSDWRASCRLDGDEAYAAGVLDAMNII